MKIELKNFKHAAFASEETLCFTASVYVDGKRLFEASNSGKGEANHLEPVNGSDWDDIRRVQDWVAKQPKIKLDNNLETSVDLDFYISHLGYREVGRRHLKSLFRKHIVIFDPNDAPGNLKQISCSQKPDITDNRRIQLEQTYPGCLIMNDLDIERALDLYIASSSLNDSEVVDVYKQITSA